MLDARRRAVLDALGIEVWRQRKSAASPAEAKAADTTAAAVRAELPQTAEPDGVMAHSSVPAGLPVDEPLPVVDEVATYDWETLRAHALVCQSCGLREKRTQVVFGVGRQDARLMVIGEAPGADEDQQGEPFVGRAGQLLNAMLAAIGFDRDQVYIANIVKCRPPGNRDPHAEEAAACRGYLERQIALVQPKLILAVGRISAQNLLGSDQAVGRLRGTVHRFEPGDVPLIVTYHPAYLLRRPQEKAKSWQDLQRAWHLLQEVSAGP